MTPKRSVILLAFALLLGGCVSAGKYKTLEKKAADVQAQLDEIHREAKGLQADLGDAKWANEQLNASKTALEKDKSELQQAKDALEAKTQELTTAQAALQARTDELAAQKAALEDEKAQLLQAAQAKQAQYDSLLGDLKKEVADGQLKITQYKNMLTVDVADKILFDSGKAALKKDGLAVLKNVAKALAKSDKVIRVVGHTDNVPLAAGAAYASNWELSAARATTVVRFLQDNGLDPKRLMAAGRGEYAPVAPNDTPEDRQKNRRIEITLLDPALVEAVTDSAPLSPTAKP